MAHPNVVNPLELRAFALETRPTVLKWTDSLLAFMTKVLGSRALFLIALTLPLLSLLPELAWSQKLVLIVSSTWIQWWALHALQRSQNASDALHEAKAETDHEALTHLAQQVDSLVVAVAKR